MSRDCNIHLTITGLTEDQFDAFCLENWEGEETITSAFGNNECYYHDDEGFLSTDYEATWDSFDYLMRLMPITKKYPKALLKFDIYYQSADENGLALIIWYMRNGKFFAPKITVDIEEFNTRRLKPVEGSIYDWEHQRKKLKAGS